MQNKKKNIIVANFKMNFNTQFEVENWLKEFAKVQERNRLIKTEVVLCPQFVLFERFVKNISGKDIFFGTQDCFWEQKGSYTGEISPMIIKTLGGSYVILGHSERKKYFGETNRMTYLKIKTAMKAGLTPILCVGESSEERNSGNMKKVIFSQLDESLGDISKANVEKVAFCYEPIWAISANTPDALLDANEIMGAKLLIKRFINDRYGEAVAEKARIIYGGSVDGKNVKEICIDAGMEGALVGSASLKPQEFGKIIEAFENNS